MGKMMAMKMEKHKSIDAVLPYCNKGETPAVEICDYSFSYPGQASVLKRLNWSVEAGSFTLLVGHTGSGKTTLLCSLKPEIIPKGEKEGLIRIFGKNLDEFSVEESAALIGYVSQSPENQIVCDSVWHELAFGLENLGVGQQAMNRRIAEVVTFFGIEAWLEKNTAELSGGQKQILVLASVLVMQPKILLLDEPTAMLDPVAEKNFIHALFRINRELGITVVVSSHKPEAFISYAQCGFEMRDGKVHALDLETIPAQKKASYESIASYRNKIAAPDSRVSVIQAKNLWFRYNKTDKYVLRGAGFGVQQGAVHAMVGGNGSGKSTLIRLVAQVLFPEHGVVKNALMHTQSFLPQNPKALFVCDTVWEELKEWQGSAGYSDERISGMLDEFGLSGLEDRHPFDISGGQQQKLAFAKVLLTEPDLLLLDEPTKGIDIEGKKDIARIFNRLKEQGKTILLVTHDLDYISCVADTVSMVFDGEIIGSEAPDEFFANNMFYRPMYMAEATESISSEGE